MTRRCEGPFGADRPFDAPSWFTALPRITASTRCPFRCASDRRSSISMPTPSAMPIPSAPSANALHRPSEDSARSREKPTNSSGSAISITPPASAIEHSPARKACVAWCRATREEEHAVSTDTAGPVRPSV